MIKPVEKKVTIIPPTAEECAQWADLTTEPARKALALRIAGDIDEWCKQAFDDGPRSHLGASIIGGPCDREIWYSFRWFKRKIFSGQMQRLFQRGHIEEERIIEYLQGIGCDVHQVNPAGEQWRVYFVGNHGGGSTDGWFGLPASYGMLPAFLLECKTINDKGFNALESVEKDKDEHWKQMCVYGYKMGLSYALYICVNKNTDHNHVEVVQLDWDLAKRLIAKAEHLVQIQVPPQRISTNPAHYVCKMCDYYGICQLRNVEIDRNCRTCKNSNPVNDGYWQCNLHRVVLPNKEAQIAGCQSWEGLEY